MPPKRRQPATKKRRTEAALHSQEPPTPDVPVTTADSSPVSTSPVQPQPTSPPLQSPPPEVAGSSAAVQPPRRSIRIRQAASSSQTPPLSPHASDSVGSDYELEASLSSATESVVDSADFSAHSDDEDVSHPIPVKISTLGEVRKLLHFSDAALRKAVQTRQQKSFFAGKPLQIAAIERLGVRDQFLEYFRRIGWSCLLSESYHPVYQEVALEFFSTFKFVDTCDLDEKSISFRLFNKHHELSLIEWSVKLGICSVEETVEYEFRSALCGFGSIESDVTHSGQSWSLLARPGAKPFDASRSSVYEIMDPVLRICHLFLCYNLIGRSTNVSKISGPDLFFLRCMHEGVRVNLGYWIAFGMHQISTHPSRHITLCHFLGAFIARTYDFIPHPSMVPCKRPTPFDLDILAAARVFYFNSDGEPRFYEPGENPPSIAVSTGPVSLEALAADVQGVREEFRQFRTEVMEQFTHIHGILDALQESLTNMSATIRQELFRQRKR